MGTRWRLIALIAAVSALLPLAAALLITAIDDGGALPMLGGLTAGMAGLFGLVVLARAVFLFERGRAAR